MGQLVRIDPSLGMAEFISNSAILTAVRPSVVLASAPNSRPRARKMADFMANSANLSQLLTRWWAAKCILA